MATPSCRIWAQDLTSGTSQHRALDSSERKFIYHSCQHLEETTPEENSMAHWQIGWLNLRNTFSVKKSNLNEFPVFFSLLVFLQTPQHWHPVQSGICNLFLSAFHIILRILEEHLKNLIWIFFKSYSSDFYFQCFEGQMYLLITTSFCLNSKWLEV
jgi:hypothetical protein